MEERLPRRRGRTLPVPQGMSPRSSRRGSDDHLLRVQQAGDDRLLGTCLRLSAVASVSSYTLFIL
jgi:hypothetical protein